MPPNGPSTDDSSASSWWAISSTMLSPGIERVARLGVPDANSKVVSPVSRSGSELAARGEPVAGESKRFRGTRSAKW